MKRKILTIALFAGLGLLSSCSDFLDIKPFSSIDDTKAVTNVEQAAAAITGVYDGLQSETYYGRNFSVFGDVLTDNISVPAKNSGRFIAEASWQVLKGTGDVTDFWNRAYSTINRANNVINANITYDVNNEAAQKAEFAQIKGEALALRAMVHFDLVRIFAQNYAFTADASHLGIPYVKKHDQNGKPARNTVKEVYQFIIADLTDALSMVTEDGRTFQGASLSPYIMSPWAIKALLARVYLTMNDFNNAKKYAVDIIDNGGFDLVPNANYVSSWGELKSSESIFTLAFNNVDYNGTNGLGYIFIEKGYGDMQANPALVGLYSSSDIRKQMFARGVKSGNGSNYYTKKFPGFGGVPGLDNNSIIRLSEIYLIAAEACAKATPVDEVNAKLYLDQIRQRAIPTAPNVDATGDALISEILLEKRKELAFENQYFFDLKRLQKTVTGAKINGTNIVINYPSDKLAWPIPQRETDVNPNMVQNPGY